MYACTNVRCAHFGRSDESVKRARQRREQKFRPWPRCSQASITRSVSTCGSSVDPGPFGRVDARKGSGEICSGGNLSKFCGLAMCCFTFYICLGRNPLYLSSLERSTALDWKCVEKSHDPFLLLAQLWHAVRTVDVQRRLRICNKIERFFSRVRALPMHVQSIDIPSRLECHRLCNCQCSYPLLYISPRLLMQSLSPTCFAIRFVSGKARQRVLGCR